MKNYKLMALMACSAFALTSCLNDDGNEQHGLTILYPKSGTSILYADQTSDSIRFYTYDSYRVVSNNTDWLTLTKSSDAALDLPQAYYIIKSVPLTLTPNTTGAIRTGSVSINSSYKDWVATGNYIQLNTLNVQRPEPKYDEANKVYIFAQADSSFVTTDSLRFTTYSDDWTLAPKPGETSTWCNIPSTQATSGKAGSYVVRYTLDNNNTGADRTMEYRLTSGGISTDIKITQFKEKE